MTLVEARWRDARRAARECADVLPSESVPVLELDGRVLAQPLTAQCDLPSFDSSAMDGWAVCGPAPWLQVGDVRAGTPFDGVLESGQAVRIATGAVVPRGASAVLRWEDARVEGDRIAGAVSPGSDIRRAGEEVRVGERIADAGTVVTPALAGFLAATGHDQVAVIRRPRVRLLLLGDELLTAGIPAGGRIRDSLGPQLPGWVQRMGAHVVTAVQVVDEISHVTDAFAAAIADADAVITTGGTAAGPRDHVHAAIAALKGELVIDRVAVRPGHPMLLATVGGVPVIGLPGNPHSAVVGLMTLGEPVMSGLLGRPRAKLVDVRAGDDVRGTPGHTRLVAGRIEDGAFVMAGYGGSAMLRGLAQATGFAVVDDDVAAGDDVAWLPLP